MKINALFTDYDGTIAPSDVNRDNSQLPSKILKNLTVLASLIPVAIITSKDYTFIRPRTQFACAWACCSGLEITLANGNTFATKKLFDLAPLMTEVRKILTEKVFIEEKKSVDDKLIGICIDWASTGMSDKSKNDLMALIRRKGAFIDYSPNYPYLDIYAAEQDKGVALLALKRLLNVKGNVMYLGDSPSDNPVFEESNVSIGINHDQPVDTLKCDYLFHYDSVADFLELLLAKKLEFSFGIVQCIGGIKREC